MPLGRERIALASASRQFSPTGEMWYNAHWISHPALPASFFERREKLPE
jgi:hypothetical protein